ncbi:hypothetical protein HPB48_007048 [Haemaphysalis longicornis]|uniref:Peptidase M13 N-terminal domain-containing protein n=1 Tax=Haemaphysalis longicornis TaxID=44386 RepID=A0A9J6GPA5_HAELO|nr:hypothetical protein HPB48_007048 [Haemaphysalis longicornis]
MEVFFRGFRKAARDAKVVTASRLLWKECIDVATLKRLGSVPLQGLLNRTGLGGWPYGTHDALPDVWESAGKLQRLMELAPLVEINLRPDNTLRLSHGYWSETPDADKVLDAMLTMRTGNSRLRQLAEDVAEFCSKLNTILNKHEPLVSHHQLSDADLALRPFLQVALEGLRPDAGVVRTELGNFIDPLVQLVRATRPETVLNVLGYRLVRHVGLFTPPVVETDLESSELSKRRSRCTHVVLEDALTVEAAEYVRYAALRSQLDVTAILSVERDLKRVLHAKLAVVPWMDNETRKSAQQRLRGHEGSEGSSQVYLPEALHSQAIATYQRFREARFRNRMLRIDVVQDDPTDPDCSYDGSANVLYLRLSSAVEIRDQRSALWPVLQAARLAPILSRCMLRALLLVVSPAPHKAQRPRNQSLAPTSVGFNGLLTCLRAQNHREKSASAGRMQSTLAAIDSGALEPARSVYDVYVGRLARKTPLDQLKKKRNLWTLLGWDQVSLGPVDLC